MKKITNFVRCLFLRKYYIKKINKLKSKSNYEPFEYLNKVTNNKRLKDGEDYHEFLMNVGFIDKKRKPLICKHCGSKKFFNCVDGSNKDYYSEEVRCNNCGVIQIASHEGKWYTF